jgi:DNA-binding transcriptional LysR family regulator
MTYTLKQLRYFVAAAEGGSVSAAARACRVAQPSVSAALRQLEDALGVQLFLRHHALGLSPTPAGRRLLGTTRSLLAHAAELRETAQGLGQGLAGTLELGCFATFAPFVLPGLLGAFAAEHPEIRITPHETDLDGLLEGLRSGRFELALTYALGLGQDVTFAPLVEVPVHALLPRRHALAQRATVPLVRLAREPLILLSLPRSREYFLSIFHAQGLEPRVAFETPSIEMLRGLVANGHGVSLMHSRPASEQALDGKRLAYRRLAEPVRPERLGLARLARLRPTGMAEAFAATCAGHFAGGRG